MATFLSSETIGYWGQTNNYIYADLTGTVTRSGNTVTLSGMTLSLTSRYSNSYGTGPYSFTVNGTTTSFTVSASGYSLGSYSLNSTSFSVSTSQTSASVSWSSYDGNSGSFTVNFSAGGSAPSGGYINGLSAVWNNTAGEIQVSTTSAGVSNTGGSALTALSWLLTESPYVSGIARVQRGLTSNGASSTLSNSLNAWSADVIDVGPNKLLYAGLYAVNDIGAYRYQGNSIVTPAAPARIVGYSLDQESVTLTYMTTADGGYYNKTIEYSIDGGTTWVTAGTATGGSAATGTFTITGLTADTQYTIKTRVTTTAGSTVSPDITFTTKSTKNTAFYVPSGGEAKKTQILYGSVNNQATLLTKLYGEVNGEAKLIHQGFGHNDYGYGVITYYTDNAHTTTATLVIQSQDEVNSLCKNAAAVNWQARINGVIIAALDVKELFLTEKTTSLPNRFLQGCENLTTFNMSHSSVTALPDYFLLGCSIFNMPVDLTNITSIGKSFLSNCLVFNQNVTLPSSMASIGDGFLNGCLEMIGTVDVGNLSADIIASDDRTLGCYNSSKPCYTTGITIAGANRAAWLAKFPNRDTSPYRKLIDAGN